jgi:NADH-quinone oxidoreductase subunit H
MASFIRGFFADPHSLLADLTINMIAFTAIIVLILTIAVVMVVLERKIAGRISMRPGPNRLGPNGWLQSMADAIKLIGKEDVIPKNIDQVSFRLAPMIILALPVMLLAIIPFSKELVAVDLDLGVFYYLAISGLSTFAFLMAGWGSNNKYSMVGGMRAVAQMISYEIPLVLSLLGVVMMTQTLKLSEIVVAQSTIPFILLQPLAFAVFFISGIAEINRAPFDLVEGEQEIIAGPFTEYTGMRFGMFYLSEYANMFVLAAMTTTMFLGGWQGPLLPGVVWFFLKVALLMLVIVWIRWTFPRVRIDHLMQFSWKVLVPLALLNIILTGFGIFIYDIMGIGG